MGLEWASTLQILVISQECEKNKKTAENPSNQGSRLYLLLLRKSEKYAKMPQTGDCGVDISTFSAVLCDICAANICITISQ